MDEHVPTVRAGQAKDNRAGDETTYVRCRRQTTSEIRSPTIGVAAMPDASDSTSRRVVHDAYVSDFPASATNLREIGGTADLLAPAGAADSRVKRALDVIGAVGLLFVTAPILVVAMLAIRVTSRGPVLFIQTRIGVNGHPFRLLKLRTMVVDNDEDEHAEYIEALVDGRAARHGQLFKLEDDPRRTRLGRVLRNWSIDELPQLINVLRGDMSLIGPRPSTPEEAALFDDSSRARLRVRPGLTGLWQVNGRSRLTHQEMVDLDLEYVESWSHGLHARLLIRTPFAILARETG